MSSVRCVLDRGNRRAMDRTRAGTRTHRTALRTGTASRTGATGAPGPSPPATRTRTGPSRGGATRRRQDRHWATNSGRPGARRRRWFARRAAPRPDDASDMRPDGSTWAPFRSVIALRASPPLDPAPYSPPSLGSWIPRDPNLPSVLGSRPAPRTPDLPTRRPVCPARPPARPFLPASVSPGFPLRDRHLDARLFLRVQYLDPRK